MLGHITPNVEILVSGQNYRTQWVNTSPHLKGDAAAAGNGPGYYWPMPLYAFQVLTNDYSGTMDIWTWNMKTDEVGITVEKAAFLIGQVYTMYLTKFEGTGISLLGYHTRNMPHELSIKDGQQ